MADRIERIRRKRTRAQIDKSACDRIFSQIIRARGACERCGATPPAVQLQCAHIISRRYTATRCFPSNAWCLCAACHRHLTEHPEKHVAFAHQTRGSDGYDTLKTLAYNGVGTNKVDWTALRTELNEIYARVTGS